MLSHEDLLVVIVVAGAVQLLGLVGIAFLAWDAHRGTREAIRNGKAVAAMMYQEEEHTCAVLRERGILP